MKNNFSYAAQRRFDQAAELEREAVALEAAGLTNETMQARQAAGTAKFKGRIFLELANYIERYVKRHT